MTRFCTRGFTTLLTIAIAAAVSACNDSPLGPRDSLPEGVQLSISGSTDGSGNGTFTINPNKQANVQLGNHAIHFPARSICDPAATTYGATEWDKPCILLTRPITVTAQWVETGDGRPLMEFEPALRFVPNKTVILSMTLRDEPEEDQNQLLRILWRNEQDVWVDESLTDATLESRISHGGKKVWRRIKHFSGYMVTAG